MQKPLRHSNFFVLKKIILCNLFSFDNVNPASVQFYGVEYTWYDFILYSINIVVHTWYDFIPFSINVLAYTWYDYTPYIMC